MRGPFDIWGSGRGPTRAWRPKTRVLCGAILLCACLILPPADTAGAVAAAACTAGWCLVCGMPRRLAVYSLAACAVLFVPLLLLTPWIAADGRLAISLSIGFRAGLCFFLAMATVSAIALNEIHAALAGLPLPRTVRVLLIQIINQTLFLADETARVMRAIRVRGAARGFQRFRVALAFPAVWMVRMMFRAERTAAAMTIRGYTVLHGLPGRDRPSTPRDVLAMAASGAILILAIIYRAKDCL